MDRHDQLFTDFVAGHIDTLYRCLYPQLLTYTLRRLGNDFAFLAEDCVQNSIFKAYQQRCQFQTELSLKAFLYTCIHNEVVSILRKQYAQNNYFESLEEQESVDFENSLIEQETLQLLYQAMNNLPAKYRTLFHLSYEKHMKNAEIAAELGISESAVKKQKAQFIELMRQQLQGKLSLETEVWLFFAILSQYG